MDPDTTRAALDGEFEHEHLELFTDPATGLRGAIAIDSRALGPAMGGVRLSSYPGMTAAALDALRLSHAMSLKNSAAGLDLGGGKAVLVDDGAWGDPRLRVERMAAFGAAIERLGGGYVTAEDVGTTPADMEAIGSATRWVAGRPAASGGRGDPSGFTARTVVGAIREAVGLHLGALDLSGLRVGVMGVGNVGARVARMLAEAGAVPVVGDVVSARAEALAAEIGGSVVPPADVVLQDLDVLAPCALGGAIEQGHVAHLRARVIAGAANNQLADQATAAALHDAGILYVPDFLANSGGIIHVAAEVLGFGNEEVERRIEVAIERTATLLREARAEERVPWDIALEAASRRIEAAAAEATAARGSAVTEVAL